LIEQSRIDSPIKPANDAAMVSLTDDQSTAITQLLQMKSGTALLHGVTGSGKTEVYKALAMEAAARGKSSIILVPEISLTAQLVGEFQRDFEHVIVTHSKQTEAQRHQIWLSALAATEPTIVIGPRSALFMPIRNLGFIAIDECHEPSYKQEKAPRYNALRAASVLADKTGARLVLGSATPLITDYYTAQKLNRPIIEMNRLAKKDAVRPNTEIIDMTKRTNFGKNQIFTTPLIAEMTRVLDVKKQVLLFHNRRGTASVTLCENCGWSAQCPRCFIPLTLHADKHQLRCHICGYSEKPLTSCPDCHNADIIHRGIGTKRIEEETRRLFPDARIKRFDGDSIKGEGVHDLFDDMRLGNIDVIIGTQTIAKGLDLPNLALVGIVQADAGLMLPDFSSSERTFQLIAQATGRVGRSSDKTKAIIQTYQPTHPAVRHGVAQDYKGFYDFEIANRRKSHFPPFSHLLKLTNSYKTEKSAITNAKKLAASFAGLTGESRQLNILGPTPAFYERQRNNWRWQIVVRSSTRSELARIAASVPLKNWSVELDPTSLI
jgi:primosomal protein N' (replication factor Y)